MVGEVWPWSGGYGHSRGGDGHAEAIFCRIFAQLSLNKNLKSQGRGGDEHDQGGDGHGRGGDGHGRTFLALLYNTTGVLQYYTSVQDMHSRGQG